jgi:hypothetical protein
MTESEETRPQWTAQDTISRETRVLDATRREEEATAKAVNTAYTEHARKVRHPISERI